MFSTFRQFLVPIVERMNASMVVGGRGHDIELDEVCFRSKPLENSILWLRYLAIVRRGSSKVFIATLPEKLVTGGQGGGGAISLPELKRIIQPASESPKLAVGSVCHTDSARSYKVMGALYDGSMASADFEQLRLGHTCVRHKPPHTQFTRIFNVRVWNGAQYQEET